MASDDLLYMAGGWGQRSSTFRFELLDENLDLQGTLTVDKERPPSIECDVDSNLKRKLGGMWVAKSDATEIDMLSARIKVWMTIAGRSEYGAGDYPLGVYLFSDPGEQLRSSNPWIQFDGLDQLSLFESELEKTWAVAPGTLIADALRIRYEAHKITQFQIDPISTKVRGNEWIVWKAGEVGRTVVQDLSDLGAMYSPFFDNNGIGRSIRVPDMRAVDPTFQYGYGRGIFMDSPERAKDTWKLPNRFIVVASGNNDENISGYWDVPSSAPHSIQKRGRIISVTYEVQGVETNEDATAMARAKGQTYKQVYETVSASGPINPLHDTFDIVAFEGIKYHEAGWGIVCRDGEDMEHQWRRIYDDEELAA